jgi:hypothetical protein
MHRRARFRQGLRQRSRRLDRNVQEGDTRLLPRELADDELTYAGATARDQHYFVLQIRINRAHLTSSSPIVTG